MSLDTEIEKTEQYIHETKQYLQTIAAHLHLKSYIHNVREVLKLEEERLLDLKLKRLLKGE